MVNQKQKTTKEGPCEKIRLAKRPINIGTSIEQKLWKPTTRKGHISSEPICGKPSYKAIPPYLGPKVIDSKKKSAPAYSLGKRITQKHIGYEAGPASVNIRKLCNKGPQTAQAFTLTSRKPDFKKSQSPSANKYSIEKSLKLITKSVPTFSFRKRPGSIKTMQTPAPNVYNLPPVFGTAKEGQIKAAPAFSMLGRAKPRQIPAQILPGPGEYENNYRYVQKMSPRFTFHKKHKVISDEDMKPGPGSHCPERYFKHKSVPAPTFSIPHTPYLGHRKAYLMQESQCSTKPPWIL